MVEGISRLKNAIYLRSVLMRSIKQEIKNVKKKKCILKTKLGKFPLA